MPTKPSRYGDAAVAHAMVTAAADALDFYANAFGAEELFRIADDTGTVIHAEISIQGQVVMIREPYGVFAGPDELGATSVELHIFVDDVEAMYARATDAGAEVLEPPFDTFHGDREVIVRDPHGHVWSFFEHLEDLGIDEIVRRGNELLRA